MNYLNKATSICLFKIYDYKHDNWLENNVNKLIKLRFQIPPFFKTFN